MKSLMKWGCITIVVMVLVLGILLATSSDDTERTGQISDSAKSQPAQSIPPTLVPLAPGFDEMLTEAAGMTDAQRNTYLDGFVGQRVERWAGTICDVTETFGIYYVEVTVDHSDDGILCTKEARWKVTKEQALEYAKEQEVVFSGIIEGMDEMMGQFSFKLKDVTLH